MPVAIEIRDGRDLRASRGPRVARLSHPDDDEAVVRMGHPEYGRDEAAKDGPPGLVVTWTA